MESAGIYDEELEGLGYEFTTPEWYEDQDAAVRALCEGKRMVSDVLFTPFEEAAGELAELRFTLGERRKSVIVG